MAYDVPVEKVQEPTAKVASEAQKPQSRHPLANTNFRLLFVGQTVSLFGDQFYAVALPWLVFQLTGSLVAFGTLLMVDGIPQVLFTLVGGVLTDRFSPHAVMTVSNALRLVVTVILALLVITNTMQTWMLYVIAFSFGTINAFFQPAAMAIIPALVDEDMLQSANAYSQGSAQLSGAVGPAVAGLVVAAFGMAAAFVFDALTFVWAGISLLQMRVPALPKSEQPADHKNMLHEIAEMFRFVRRDSLLSLLMGISLILNFLFVGPMIVGTAALARDRFPGGPTDLGVMLAALGIGSLIGTIIGATQHPRRLGALILICVSAAGLLLALLSIAPTVVIASGLLFILGAALGVTNVLAFTWIQKRIVPEMMGRVMSLVALASVGLTPLSNGFAGLIASVRLPALFVGPGVLLVALCLFAGTNAELRQMT